MPSHVIFQDCQTWQQEAIRSYWLQKVPRIERLVTRFPEDRRELRLTVRCRPRGYDLHVVLLLPTGSLAAEASAQTDHEAVDAVVGTLVAEIRRHKEVIRREYLYRRKQRRQELSRRATASLPPDVPGPDKETFFDLLGPLMDPLRDHVRHELIVAKLQGRIGREQVTVADLLDEVILRAWTRLDGKSEAEPLEIWLTRLLHEVLDEQAAGMEQMLSLDEQVDSGESGGGAVAEPIADDAPIWEEVPIWEEAPTLTFEDVLPSHEMSEPWQQLAAIDQMKWVLVQLGSVSANQRRAFTLYLLDGWEPEEIAMIQGRSVEQIRADIQAVQEMLRSRMGESEMHLSGSALIRHAQQGQK